MLVSSLFLTGNFLSVLFTENECKLHFKGSVAICSDVQCQDCFECQTQKIKATDNDSFLAFFSLGRVVS